MKKLTYSNDPTRSSRKAQIGATLIEILIAVLILSFGLLGMAALQTRALQGNATSIQRSQALMMSNLMMDLMRLDRIEAQKGNYNTSNFVNNGSAFTGTNLYDDNRKYWIDTTRALLGSSFDVQGSIACVSNSFTCTVKMKWKETERSESSSTDLTEVSITSTI